MAAVAEEEEGETKAETSSPGEIRIRGAGIRINSQEGTRDNNTQSNNSLIRASGAMQRFSPGTAEVAARGAATESKM